MVIASRICLITSDTIVLVVTWFATYNMGMLRRTSQWNYTPFWKTLFRDGEWLGAFHLWCPVLCERQEPSTSGIDANTQLQMNSHGTNYWLSGTGSALAILNVLDLVFSLHMVSLPYPYCISKMFSEFSATMVQIKNPNLNPSCYVVIFIGPYVDHMHHCCALSVVLQLTWFAL